MSEATSTKAKAHEATIVINGTAHVVTSKELTFSEVVALAYDGNPPSGPNWIFTVSYRKGEDKKPMGTLVAGDSIKVKDGMIFNVTATDKS